MRNFFKRLLAFCRHERVQPAKSTAAVGDPPPTFDPGGSPTSVGRGPTEESPPVGGISIRTDGTATIVTIPVNAYRSDLTGVVQQLQDVVAEVSATLIVDLTDLLAEQDAGVAGMMVASERVTLMLRLLEPLRWDLKVRGRHLLLVTPASFHDRFRMSGFSQVMSAQSEAVDIAGGLQIEPPPPLDESTRATLTAIQERLEQLVRERTAHLWQPHSLPDIVQQYACGRREGGQGFPYGGFKLAGRRRRAGSETQLPGSCPAGRRLGVCL